MCGGLGCVVVDFEEVVVPVVVEEEEDLAVGGEEHAVAPACVGVDGGVGGELEFAVFAAGVAYGLVGFFRAGVVVADCWVGVG